jgi:Phosphotransferase enzyme family
MPEFSRDSIQADYSSRLARIADDLPDRYRPLLSNLMGQIPSLFDPSYPMVINHWDLLENNMHVDEQTGHITGIVDWRDAKAGPFAVQFWGLENILGIRRSACMDFHPRHVELRRLFWHMLFAEIGNEVPQAAVDAMRTARMVGIFLANDDIVGSPLDERVRDLAVLQSLTLLLDDIGLEEDQLV